jgi:transcriptional regulator with XRE-family HTH domain
MNNDIPGTTAVDRVTDFLKHLRAKRGLTQKEIAKRLGVTQASLSELEARGEATSIRKLQEVIAAVGGQLTIRVSFPDSAEVEEMHLPVLRDLLVGIQQGRLRKKSRRKEQQPVSQSTRDYTRFDVTLHRDTWRCQNKRWAMWRIVKFLCDSGVTPGQIAACLTWRGGRLFWGVDGNVDGAEFLAEMQRSGIDSTRYFCKPDELLVVNGRTYALSNQWGPRTEEAIRLLVAAFPNRGLSYERASPPTDWGTDLPDTL